MIAAYTNLFLDNKPSRYNLKHRFWRIFAARRQALHSHATSIQSGWRFHRCRSVFSAVRKAFVCLEAATKSVERYWSIIECKDGTYYY